MTVHVGTPPVLEEPSAISAQLGRARLVADAVLYEGYLLYPYRASSSKNQVRWQFGILGPPAAEPGIGEPAEMQAECLLAGADAGVTVHLRFLHLQTRQAQDAEGRPMPGLTVDGTTWLSWEEAVPVEVVLGPLATDGLGSGRTLLVDVPGGEDVETVADRTGAIRGRLIRRREALRAEVDLRTEADGPVLRLRIIMRNATAGAAPDRDAAIARSFLGAHALLQAHRARFVSLLEPPPEAEQAVSRCVNLRCWPVLASPAEDVLLVSPIILYDHPAIAEQSSGALFDSTEIDEILTLRVMTLTDAEKAEARATDPQAAAIIDRCDNMSAEDLQRLHGVLRNPHAAMPDPMSGAVPAFIADTGIGPADDWEIPTWADTGGKPWWDPAIDAGVSPETDAVVVGGVNVCRGSRVRVRPRRRADAQDIFFADRLATVAAVYADVDGNDHVAVVLTDDPAADLHEWYGRYLYFAPDELEPLANPDAGREV